MWPVTRLHWRKNHGTTLTQERRYAACFRTGTDWRLSARYAPLLWVVLTAVILVLASLFVWSSVTAVESYATGHAEVRGGVLTLAFDNAETAERINVGMNVRVGDMLTPVLSIGHDNNGNLLAVANIALADGSYDARVGYKSTHIIEMLFR